MGSADGEKATIGLSPRLRGNQHSGRRRSSPRRSIPAPAGEPRGTSRRCLPFWVYPRACGGTASAMPGPGHHNGLSPRLRGNRCSGPNATITIGSIPAPAGEPLHSSIRSSPGTVYPRACGGTYCGELRVMEIDGLSPRLRGNHFGQGHGRGRSGSIPAPAGEPATIGAIVA